MNKATIIIPFSDRNLVMIRHLHNIVLDSMKHSVFISRLGLTSFSRMLCLSSLQNQVKENNSLLDVKVEM